MEKKIGNYDVIKPLKRGAQGLIYLVKNENDEKLVIKSMFVDLQMKEEAEGVLKNWKELSLEKNIVSYIEHFFDENNLYCVMKYCSNGDLETLIKKKNSQNEKFTESEVIHAMIGGISGLGAMHSKNFIHRDIKPANLLLDENGTLLISDFGTAKIMGKEKSTMTMVGSILYMAPEVLNNEEYSFPADIFSLGVVLYEMMVGINPFLGERGPKTACLLRAEYLPISPKLGYSTDLVNLVHSCLALVWLMLCAFLLFHFTLFCLFTTSLCIHIQDPAKRPTPANIVLSPLVTQVIRADEENARIKREIKAELQIEVLAELQKLIRMQNEKLAEQSLQIADLKKKVSDESGKMKFPEFGKGSSLAWGRTGGNISQNGWIYAKAYGLDDKGVPSMAFLQINQHCFTIIAHSADGSVFVPVAKGDTYASWGGSYPVLTFFPMRE